MQFLSLVSILSLALASLAQDTSLKAVKAAFDATNLPAEIFITFDPTVLLEVTFPETGAPITLHAGENVPRNDTVGPPTFRVVGDAGNGPFVVAAVDPDAPTPQDPTSAQIRHFLGGNFFAKKLETGSLLVNVTPAISEFRQPTPPAGSDAHRYTFLLFKQPLGFNQQTLVTPATPISLFNISAFAEAVGLGNPIGGTFMRVAPDPTT